MTTLATNPASGLTGDLDAAITRAAVEQPDQPWATRWTRIHSCGDCQAPAGAACANDCPSMAVEAASWTLAEIDSWTAGDLS